MLGERAPNAGQDRFDGDFRHRRGFRAIPFGPGMVEHVQAGMVQGRNLSARDPAVVERHQRNVEGAHDMRQARIQTEIEIGQAHQRSAFAQGEAPGKERSPASKLLLEPARALALFAAAENQDVGVRPFGGNARR